MPHGAPESLGAGICFGLASHLEIGNDYIGRPINIASRLRGACPSSQVYDDRSAPDIPLNFKKDESVTHINLMAVTTSAPLSTWTPNPSESEASTLTS
jgi:hypothetical protein